VVPAQDLTYPLFGEVDTFVVGSLLWGVAFDGFTPDLYDLVGAVVCLVGVGLIMYAPR
jgi:small multidrug resistance family-3 protein